MGVAGKREVGVTLREVHQGPHQVHDVLHEVGDQALHAELQVGGHLVVARTTGVQLARQVADPLLQGRLHVGVDVLDLAVADTIGRDLHVHLAQGGDELLHFCGTQDTRAAQGFGPGDAALDIATPQTRIEIDAAVERLEERIQASPQATLPHHTHAWDSLSTLAATVPGRP